MKTRIIKLIAFSLQETCPLPILVAMFFRGLITRLLKMNRNARACFQVCNLLYIYKKNPYSPRFLSVH